MELSKKELVYPRKPEDSRINWNKSVSDVHALVRASSQPFDGAYCFLENNVKCIIWKSEFKEVDFQFFAIPGQVCDLDNNYPLISCNDQNAFLKIIKYELVFENENSLNVKPFSSLRNRLY